MDFGGYEELDEDNDDEMELEKGYGTTELTAACISVHALAGNQNKNQRNREWFTITHLY